MDPKKDVVLDVSSTSSEESDHDTPLTQLQTQELLAKVTKKEQNLVIYKDSFLVSLSFESLVVMTANIYRAVFLV